MPWKTEILKKEEVICSECSGTIRYNQVVKMISDSIKVGKKNSIDKHLFDNRTSKLDLSILEIYELPRAFKYEGLEPWAKIAILLPSELIDNKNFDFFETVCLNKGINLQFFTDKNTAFNWLKK